jgi:four helix bundle protein
MAKIKRFEDLECWKKARELCQHVFIVWQKIKNDKNFQLAEQMLSSSGSTMDNISEGFLRGGNKEFCHFLSISRGSCGEVQSQLYRAHDYEHITNEEFKKGYNLAEETISLISGMIKYLKTSDQKGYRFD